MQRTGAPYAADFAPPNPLCTTPWTQAFYCSSLVDHAYREALRQELVFSSEPFPLIWEPEGFWTQFYRRARLTTRVSALTLPFCCTAPGWPSPSSSTASPAKRCTNSSDPGASRILRS